MRYICELTLKGKDKWAYLKSDYLKVVHMLSLSDILSLSKVLVFHYHELDLFTEFQNTCFFVFSINFCLFFPAKTIFGIVTSFEGPIDLLLNYVKILFH